MLLQVCWPESFVISFRLGIRMCDICVGWVVMVCSGIRQQIQIWRSSLIKRIYSVLAFLYNTLRKRCGTRHVVTSVHAFGDHV